MNDRSTDRHGTYTCKLCIRYNAIYTVFDRLCATYPTWGHRLWYWWRYKITLLLLFISLGSGCSRGKQKN